MDRQPRLPGFTVPPEHLDEERVHELARVIAHPTGATVSRAPLTIRFDAGVDDGFEFFERDGQATGLFGV